MNNKQLVLSEDGYKKLKDELEERKTVTRRKIADDIDLAAQQGDLSENASYKAALEEKEFNEAQISKLENMVLNAVVQKKVSGDKIGLGSKILVKIEGSDREMEFSIVGQNEADPISRKISIESPIGAALMNKKKDDKVEIKTPNGLITYNILNVE